MNSTTQLLIRLGGPTISELVSFLSKNLNKYEIIECYEWTGDLGTSMSSSTERQVTHSGSW